MRISADRLGPEPKQPPGFTMDTPFRRGSVGQTHMTRMLGHVLNNPALAGLKPEDGPSKVMIRANNLASLVAATLLKLQPEKREEALVAIGGVNFTADVLRFAKEYPGALGISDAIRFSLALHFLIGILHAEAKEVSFYSEGYLKFARYYKDVQDMRRVRAEDSAPIQGLGGLGALGQHKILIGEEWPRGSETPAQGLARARARAASWDQWCRDNAGQTYDPALLNKCLNPPIGCDTNPPESNEGRRCRGLVTGWTKPGPAGMTYPAPANIPSIDLSKMQAAACGDLLAPLIQRQQEKVAGVRKHFQTIFGRAPNNAEVEYYGKSRWCASTTTNDDAMKSMMVRVRDAIVAKQINTTTPTPTDGGPVTPYDTSFRDAGTDVVDSLQKAADAAFDALGKVSDFVADIMCRGFKGIFGPQVGGVICDIITFFTRAMVAGIASVVDIIIESLQGTFAFIKLMIAGKVEEAFKALMQSLGRALFSLASPIMIPVLMANCQKIGGQVVCSGMSMSEAFKKLKAKADRVVEKEPLWPIMTIMAVVGMFSVVSGNVMDPLVKLILAITPMAATFISEPLRQNIRELAQTPLDELEKSIGKFIKFVLMMVQGFMKIGELITNFRTQLMAYFSKQNAASLTGGAKTSATDRIKYVIDKLSNGINVVVNAIKKFNVRDLTQAAEPLLNLIPDLLLAILPDDMVASVPSLTEWRDGIKKMVKDTNEAEDTMKKGAKELLANIQKVTQIQFYKEQIAPMPAEEAAAIVANVVGTQFKTNKAAFPTFVASFRAELLKV